VTYWTGVWEPTREAISKQVAWLRATLAPGSPIVSFTAQSSAIYVRERVLRLNFHRWYALRAAALALERAGSVTHIFGGIGTTEHLLHVLGRRPILFTVVIPGAASPPESYRHVRHFVAESRVLAETLTRAGVPHDRVDIIYPAIDVDHYAPAPPPEGRFTLLFASSPADSSEIDARGVGLLIDLARLRPDIDVVVLWRQWGDVAEARRVIDGRSPPRNFRLEHRDARNMADVYLNAHATACFFDAGVGKSAPNSVVEGLASGRPALLTDTCGVADIVGAWQAGVVCPRDITALVGSIDELRRDYPRYALQARRLAEQEFDSRRALARYAALYERLGVPEAA